MQHHRVISAVKRQSGTSCRALKSVCAVFSNKIRNVPAANGALL